MNLLRLHLVFFHEQRSPESHAETVEDQWSKVEERYRSGSRLGGAGGARSTADDVIIY